MPKQRLLLVCAVAALIVGVAELLWLPPAAGSIAGDWVHRYPNRFALLINSFVALAVAGAVLGYELYHGKEERRAQHERDHQRLHNGALAEAWTNWRGMDFAHSGTLAPRVMQSLVAGLGAGPEAVLEARAAFLLLQNCTSDRNWQALWDWAGPEGIEARCRRLSEAQEHFRRIHQLASQLLLMLQAAETGGTPLRLSQDDPALVGLQDSIEAVRDVMRDLPTRL